MSTELNRDQVNQLIAQKRYEDAKRILQQSTDPGAKAWLDSLERQFPKHTLSASGMSGSSGAASYLKAQERGGCLSVWLVFLIIVNPLLALYYLASGSSLSSLLHIPTWVLPVLAIFGVVNTVCAIGIWQWKKWGAYGFIGASIIVFFLNLISLGLNASTVGGLIGVGLMWYLLQNRWEMFD